MVLVLGVSELNHHLGAKHFNLTDNLGEKHVTQLGDSNPGPMAYRAHALPLRYLVTHP